MRTLLVDNYDSFTHNLAHYLAEVNGVPPVVMRNDDPGWHPDLLADFDNVVLSPGPGTPERAPDVGVCRDLVRECRLPLLGVCLGHQSIALEAGATVARAPEPRHGRLSAIRHRGTDLFAGLPDPLDVVRYHSLAVSGVPPSLEVTAWTEDGVVMGLRHRDRPMWGVQFHPESIRTSHGRELLGNFADLTRRAAGGRRRAVPRPSPPAAPQPARVRRLRVLAERLPTRWDDEVVFDRLFRGAAEAFWLDASRRDAGAGRFSVMGDAGGPLARLARGDVRRDSVVVRGSGGVRLVPGGFLDWLDRDLRSLRVEVPPLPFDFALGWVGYLGYGLKAECGADPAHPAEEPDAMAVFADRALVFDHETATTYLLALAEDGDEAPARSWIARTRHELHRLAGQRPAPAPGPLPATPVRLRHDRDRYLALIAECQELIAAGETYEVCLTNMVEARRAVDPWHAYRFLRRTSPAPLAALLDFGRLSVLSASPERLLRVDRHRVAESRPIKGTRPRASDPRADAGLRGELAGDEKERAENLMIVDLVRNDLGRCAEVGSVEVSGLFEVESYAHAHQMVSTVRARLRPDVSTVDCVRAAFPGGSMTGAPKLRTMEIIDRLEAGPRGVYSGAIGYLSLNGAADLSVVIRTAVVTPDRVRYGVGGAITALSDPQAEYHETAVKAVPLLRLLGTAFPGLPAAAEQPA
ncbi:aminodeoxychorismate synthase component I [Marinitenerispora sediminis]|uniref:aminodeoxychorismate synthase n=1 Tax=Marinitenerispora sediminis TaxID=1931232 RepID=A0A368T1S4_9ACTN|nr:aminodeoxychorismate synthase component I [Marinitenerispora sediminis]RCV53744.1 aminodeoxychorismate synthase component I [Marinitenerispora sediminis]RCV54077.1 aminodeoxychorismate synthase component I [Marinitenerispora sediminis]